MSGYTLHQVSLYLSLAGAVLCFGSFIGVMYAVLTKSRTTTNDALTPSETRSTVMHVKYAIRALRSLAARLSSKSSTTPTRTRGRGNWAA